MLNSLVYSRLYDWYEKNHRVLPWRETTDGYAIWLSEIILQQTRVAQGMEYYLRFIDRWPTVEDLARANEEEVLREWQGLGYYSRARNLHKAAQIIAAEVQTKERAFFPERLRHFGHYRALESTQPELSHLLRTISPTLRWTAMYTEWSHG
jgi:adenine-specific DNA glycosylase